MYNKVSDYLFHMEALTHGEAKRLWRKSIKDSWNNCCAYCDGTPITDKSLTIDHVKPRSNGGEDLLSNVVPADRNCNQMKGSMNWREWFKMQSFYEPWKEYRIEYWLQHSVVLSQDECLEALWIKNSIENFSEMVAA